MGDLIETFTEILDFEESISYFQIVEQTARQTSAVLLIYKRCCAHTHILELFRLKDVMHRSMLNSIARVLIDNKGNYLEYATDVANVDILILFGLKMIIAVKYYVNEITNELWSYSKLDLKVPLKHGERNMNLTFPASRVHFTRR